MAKVRILYWKEIPAQVQAEDESVKVSRQLDEQLADLSRAIAGASNPWSKINEDFNRVTGP